MPDLQLIVFTAVIGLFAGVIFYVTKLFSKTVEEREAITEEQQQPAEKSRKKSESGPSGKRAAGGNKHHTKEKPYEHPWLVTSLKGHSDKVLSIDMSPNDKFLASSCMDRSMILWPSKHFMSKDVKCVRGNVAFDHGLHVKWSPDAKALIVHKETSRQIEVYKIAKKEGTDAYTFTPAVEFPLLHSADDDVIALDMDSKGKFIMTCSTKKNDLALFDLKGSLITRFDTVLMTTYHANVSPCGNFIAASGFTPEVKVWNAKFSKSGAFEKVIRAYELTGHSSGVYHFTWRNDATMVATVSKDGTWRVYNVDIEFSRGEEAKLIASGKVNALPTSKVALSPDGRVVAISVDKSIKLFALGGSKWARELDNVHASAITGLLFDAEGRWLISSGDKHIRVFHNVMGYQMSLLDFKEAFLSAVTSGHKERLLQQIEEVKHRLKSIGETLWK